jgi:hypothetical protein
MDPDLAPDPDPDPLSSSKISKKNLDSCYFMNIFYVLSLKNDVNVPSKSIKQNKLLNKLFFVGILKITSVTFWSGSADPYL